MVIRARNLAAPVLAAALAFSLGCSNTGTSSTSSGSTTTADETPSEPVVQQASTSRRVGDGMLSSSEAYPTGDRRTSAILLEKVYPAEVSAGTPYYYDLHVTNLTDLSLLNVVVSESLDGGFEMSGSDPDPSSAAGDSVSWAMGTLAAGETKMIRVNGHASNEGTVASCAAVTYDTALCTTTRVVSPKLRLALAAPAMVMLCDDILLEYTVCNDGSGVTEGIDILETLPAGLTTRDGSSTVRLSVDALAPGECQTIPVMARAERVGEFEVDGSATALGGLEAESNMTTTVVRQPVLTMAAECTETQFVGRNVTYTFTVGNDGDATSENTVVEAVMPGGSSFVRATEGGQPTGSTVTWNLGALAPDATRTISMTINPEQIGTYRTAASVSGACAVEARDACETKVAGIPAVLLEVVDITDPVEVGQTTTYEITVTNQGSAEDTNIQIVAQLEDAMEFVSAGGATVGTHAGGTVTFAPLASLSAKDQTTWRVVVRAAASGDVRFRVAMTTDELGRPVEESEATNFYE